MCVIYACSTEIPDKDELERGYLTNTDGAGLAWLGMTKNSKGQEVETVFFQKGLNNHEDVLKFIEKGKIQLPFAIHFRTASSGGRKDVLCHPFPIYKGAPSWLAGHCPSVFFHNGHFHNWEEWIMKVGLPAQEKFPEGSWSDSRAMSWVTWLKGEGIVPFFIGTNNRVLIFSSTPYTDEGEEYDRASDHFSFWGSGWIQKKGYAQSIDTEVRQYRQNSKSTYYGGSVYHSPASSDVAGKAMGDTKDVTPLNVWTMEELTKLLTELEEQQRDAKLAAGL